MKSKNGYLDLLRIPAFSVFLSGRVVSELGDILFTMVTMWYILQTTDSAFAASIVPLVPALTFLFLSMPLGTLTDRFSKKKVLIFTELFRGIIVFAVFILMLTDHLIPVEIYLSNFLLTTGEIMFGIAQQSALPNILPNKEKQLGPANGLMTAVKRTVTLSGYGIGGVIIAAINNSYAILFDAITFLLSALSFLFIRIPSIQSELRRGMKGFLKDCSEGMRFIWKHASLRMLILFGATINMLGAPLQFFTSVFSKTVLHAGTTGYGLLEAAAALGEIIGALISGKLSHRLKLGHWMCISFTLTGISLVLMVLFKSLWTSVLLFGLSMGGNALLNIPLITSLQLFAPENIRGRVMASFGIFFTSSVPIGLVFGGYLTTVLGPILIFMTIGLINILGGILALFIKRFYENAITEENASKRSTV
ncbi:MFS transporter [Caenibacillus caldisaponilyticus]|uniref:MFS transporter n=1 Tax=Caenibacillus caldisaponilyticus TaxID=1674942 RepID=UPI000988614B|nr:MFS transporter [Caenibacillus caldisaponilyticus]